MVNVDAYRSMLAQPWGKIQYEITFAQLTHLENKEILDFGAGFGLVSDFLSQNNKVIAVEPNADMLFADDSQTFTKLHGSLDVLESFADQTFDVICCHNVLEYIEPKERTAYLDQFRRLLKPNGQLSVIKHNPAGKVLQAVVFSNDTELAQNLLDGKEFHSQSFSQGSTYSTEDLLYWSKMTLENYLAIRTFYSLQPNIFKTEKDWLEKMTKIELAVADQKPYKDISFLQHVWLRKE